MVVHIEIANKGESRLDASSLGLRLVYPGLLIDDSDDSDAISRSLVQALIRSTSDSPSSCPAIQPPSLDPTNGPDGTCHPCLRW
jgi:hypothetical protein